MAHTSKRYNGIRTKVDHVKLYPVQEALKIVKENATARFNESVDVSINLGVDPKKSDQAVRGSLVLPQGTGKTVRVAVFAQGERAAQAKEAGADIVGFEDLAVHRGSRSAGRQTSWDSRISRTKSRAASSISMW